MIDEESADQDDVATEQDEAEIEKGELSILQDLSEESRVSLDHQIEAIQNSATQSFQVLRLNIVLLGALLSAVPVAAQLGRDLSVFVNVYSITGAITLFGSVVFAAVAITVTNYTAGIGSQGVSQAIDNDLSYKEFYEMLSNGYSNWLIGNYSTMKKQSTSFYLCMALFLDSLLFLGSGVVAGLYTPDFGSRVFYYLLVLTFALTADFGLYWTRNASLDRFRS